MSNRSRSDVAITEEEAARGGVELMCKHSHFETVGTLKSRCDCGWSHSGTQGGCTQASRRHVRANPDHKVVTVREQAKVTYMRKVTVLR